MPPSAGVLLNQLLPSWAVTFLLIPLLIFLTYRCGAAAVRLHSSESRAAAGGGLPSYQDPMSDSEEEEGPPSDCGCLGSGSAVKAPLPPQLAATLAVAQQQARQGQAAAQRQAAREPCAFPWRHGAELVLLWMVLLEFQVGKGHFGHCSWQFAALFGGQAATAVAASAYFIRQAVYAAPQESASAELAAAAAASSSSVAPAGSSSGEGGPPAPAHQPPAGAAAHQGALTPCAGMDTAAWGPECLAQSAGIALVGGSLAGLCGIGGGMIVGPLMLGERWRRWAPTRVWGRPCGCNTCAVQ